VTGQSAVPDWPSAFPPVASDALNWRLSDVAELPRIRAELRRHLDRQGGRDQRAVDLRDRLVLALDEMASNALRHGGGTVEAAVREAGSEYLIEVSDQAYTHPPVPAVGRDPSEGGLGLYLIAELATKHGWYVRDGCKHVWALLPR
jgi:anti-sigma regulatory factor (Ser/Thr protein kinase)